MHDPLDTPKATGETQFQTFLILLGLKKRNKADQRQQDAADRNAVWHEADAERKARQPGSQS